MEPKDWIAVAQVYATLVHARTVEAGQFMGSSQQQRLAQAVVLEVKARSALRAAGVTDA